ncbi:flavoprotein [Peribacillus frigoritolerans]|uniref:flavoprotein n=1 Tax=Peribacillus castrilensis TaxID=2897690 RepID=UPI003DA527B9
MSDELKDKNLLIGVTGAISSVGISQYLLYFKNYFKEIRVIVSESAADLIPANTISYFCDYVYTEKSVIDNKKYNHMNIGKWADVYCVLPATANTIAHVANGMAKNLLTTTVLAHPYPTLFFPSMNEVMWEKKALLRNLKQLELDGHHIATPQSIMAYEVSSGERRPNRVIPTPDKALIEISEAIKKREEEMFYSKS